MKLTIGMAHFDDYDGVYFTTQTLRLHHDLRNVELIVIDNSPHTPAGEAVKVFIEHWAGAGTAGARYIPMPDAVGTTPPREAIFREATGDAVLVLDCHVLLAPGSIERLIAWYEAHPDCQDLLSGPLLYDDLTNIATHFRDEWRAEMWGVWDRDPRGDALDAEPFEIWGQGLGLFSCRRDVWLGFNEHFRGFGGEEGYIHEKFRLAGRKSLCLPFLRWVHRFGRPGGVRYPLSRWNKVRNYVLGHQELGLSLEPVHAHFVTSGLMSSVDWEYLLADPVGHETPPAGSNCGTCGGSRPQPSAHSSIDELFAFVRSEPRDLDQHADKIRELASQVEHVTAFVKRREWNALLAAGRPETLIVYQTEPDPLLDAVHAAIRTEQAGKEKHTRVYTTHVGADSLATEPSGETDMLVIDTVHRADRLWAELERHAARVKRFLVLRGTGAFGEVAEGGNAPGLLPALRGFVHQHPEWSVVYHTDAQYGLTVLSRDKRDKPTLPGKIEMATNLAKAVAAHVADGLEKVSTDELQARLEVCTLCPQRRDDRCAVCGCFLAPKAAMRSSDCPLGLWPAPIEQQEKAA